MGKLVLFMHVSLDWFVTNAEGGMNWIKISDEMFDMAGKRSAAAKTALYGRGTYEIMEAYWPTAGDKPNAGKHDIEHSAWYNSVDKVVVSETMRGQKLPKTTIISDDVVNQITALKQNTEGEIIMFGSPGLAAFFMEHGLIDEYWLLVNPIILGAGKPLHRGFKNPIPLKLAESTTFRDGVICLHLVRE